MQVIIVGCGRAGSGLAETLEVAGLDAGDEALLLAGAAIDDDEIRDLLASGS